MPEQGLPIINTRKDFYGSVHISIGRRKKHTLLGDTICQASSQIYFSQPCVATVTSIPPLRNWGCERISDWPRQKGAGLGFTPQLPDYIFECVDPISPRHRGGVCFGCLAGCEGQVLRRSIKFKLFQPKLITVLGQEPKYYFLLLWPFRSVLECTRILLLKRIPAWFREWEPEFQLAFILTQQKMPEVKGGRENT